MMMNRKMEKTVTGVLLLGFIVLFWALVVWVVKWAVF
jgi:hypothetical protein